jgi:AcrR family transcriptional regulator
MNMKTARKTTLIGSRDQKRLDRKAAIVDAAERVFSMKPFPKVSMRDIAKEAGISPALIYRHFPDQQHLFVEAFLRGAARLLDQFKKEYSGKRPATLEETAEAFITYLTDNEQYFKMMTHFMLEGSVHEVLLDKINTTERSLLDIFDSLFRKMGARENTRIMSHCFFAALNGIIITFRRYPGRTREELKKHMDHLGRIMARMFINAVKSNGADIFS